MVDNNKIFERVDDVIYSRDIGTANRTEVRRDNSWGEKVKEDKMWGEIRRMAKTNPTLQEAVDHVIMIYKLSKEYNDGNV